MICVRPERSSSQRFVAVRGPGAWQNGPPTRSFASCEPAPRDGHRTHRTEMRLILHVRAVATGGGTIVHAHLQPTAS